MEVGKAIQMLGLPVLFLGVSTGQLSWKTKYFPGFFSKSSNPALPNQLAESSYDNTGMLSHLRSSPRTEATQIEIGTASRINQQEASTESQEMQILKENTRR